jgi:hypothetical protein
LSRPATLTNRVGREKEKLSSEITIVKDLNRKIEVKPTPSSTSNPQDHPQTNNISSKNKSQESSSNHQYSPLFLSSSSSQSQNPDITLSSTSSFQKFPAANNISSKNKKTKDQLSWTSVLFR